MLAALRREFIPGKVVILRPVQDPELSELLNIPEI